MVIHPNCVMKINTYIILTMTEIVITSAKRTPIGKFLGSLSNFSAPELGKFALDAVIEESKINKMK